MSPTCARDDKFKFLLQELEEDPDYLPDEMGQKIYENFSEEDLADILRRIRNYNDDHEEKYGKNLKFDLSNLSDGVYLINGVKVIKN